MATGPGSPAGVPGPVVFIFMPGASTHPDSAMQAVKTSASARRRLLAVDAIEVFMDSFLLRGA
ncbi:hypothetical protein F7R13_32880 [Burkholderia territorii]|uniref:Uncharacterized protein n=1 Tax=Burkholderia territorii TaxID=1503055 RepID=A0A6L3N6I8_9BURK|nr:hypothetical protein F7R13_32880 [Burkholderia territorii]